jgi:hypothetical protein
MSLKPLKITFQMDGTGTFYDPSEPMHLDGLLAWVLCLYQTNGEPPAADEEPFEVRLPLGIWRIGGHWGWCASAILPVDSGAWGMQRFVKRFRENRMEITKGSPNTRMSTYRKYCVPMPLLLNREFEAYVFGSRKRVHQVLKKNIRYLGRKRSVGKGRIVDINTEVIDEDFSLIRDGLAMRYLPLNGASRLVRTRPPYWNRHDRTECCDVGDCYTL